MHRTRSNTIEQFAELMVHLTDPFADRQLVLASAGLDDAAWDELVAWWSGRLEPGGKEAEELARRLAEEYARVRRAAADRQSHNAASNPARDPRFLSPVAQSWRSEAAAVPLGASAGDAPPLAKPTDVAHLPRPGSPLPMGIGSDQLGPRRGLHARSSSIGTSPCCRSCDPTPHLRHRPLPNTRASTENGALALPRRAPIRRSSSVGSRPPRCSPFTVELAARRVAPAMSARASLLADGGCDSTRRRACHFPNHVGSICRHRHPPHRTRRGIDRGDDFTPFEPARAARPVRHGRRGSPSRRSEHERARPEVGQVQAISDDPAR